MRDKNKIEICYKCNREFENVVHRVKIIDEKGRQTFENTCSDECATEVIEKLYLLHQSRADDMKQQIVQKLAME